MKKLALSAFAVVILNVAARAQCFYDAMVLYEIVESWEEGGVEVKFTDINGHLAPIYGIKGGWFLGSDQVLLGVTGNFSYTDWIELQSLPTNFVMYYGGLYLDVNFTPNRPMHMSSNITLGFGGAETSGRETYQNGSATFFLIEPNANMKLRLASFCKFGIGAGYRYAIGAGTSYLQARDVSGPSLNLMLMFGSY
jgi:hypothetical protein